MNGRFRNRRPLDPDFDANVGATLQQLGVTIADCDVVLDLEAPAWDPQDVLINIVTAAIQASNTMATARSLILGGTSFPASMAEVTGPIQFWPRREWTFFRALLAALGETVRKPTFADYAVAATLSQMAGFGIKLKWTEGPKSGAKLTCRPAIWNVHSPNLRC